MADLSTRFPSYPVFQGMNFKTNTPTQMSNTMSGKIRRVGQGVSYYSWEVQYPQLTRLEAGTVKGYLAQCLGPQFSFEIIIPTISYSALLNQTTNVPSVGGTVSIGATNCILKGCGANKNVLAAGDYFKFNNGTKVYQCVSPCNSDASGNATLFFSGPCVKEAPLNTTLTITAVPFTAILAEEAQEYDVGLGGITSISIAMREVW